MITIAVVGRPNVGKSTLFNALANRNIAITHKTPGVTRDVNSIDIVYEGLELRLLDTGGISRDGIFANDISAASLETIQHADIIFFVVSVEEITAEDEAIAESLRKSRASVLLVVNKVDNEKRTWELGEFYRFGFKNMASVSALHRRNFDDLWNFCKAAVHDTTQNSTENKEHASDDEMPNDAVDKPHTPDSTIRFMLLGKPNTGKSSVMNYIAGKNRSLVSDMPGTTRDVVEEHVHIHGKYYCLVDSAGIRRKTKIHDDVEYYSSHRAISGILRADIVVLLIDVQDDFSDQDKKLAMLVLDRGKGLVIGLNKWDLVEVKANRLHAERDRIQFLAPQLHFVPVVPISAHSGYGIDKMLDTVNHVHAQLRTRIITSLLNRDIERWVLNTPPPLVRGKRGKVKFAAQLQGDSIVFEVHVNTPKLFSSTYAQYLINCIRRQYSLIHVPMKLQFVNKSANVV